MPAPSHRPVGVGDPGVPPLRLPRLPAHEPFVHVRARETLAARDACVDQHQHIRTHLLQEAVRSMHFRNLLAADRESHHPMAATLSQEHTAHLRIGAWPILIEARDQRPPHWLWYQGW